MTFLFNGMSKRSFDASRSVRLGEDYGGGAEPSISGLLTWGARGNAAGREVDARRAMTVPRRLRACEGCSGRCRARGSAAGARGAIPGRAGRRCACAWLRACIRASRPWPASVTSSLGVHRAARICAAAHGGHSCLPRRRRRAALGADEVLPDIAFRDLGEHRLKDLDRSERLFQLAVPDLPSEFPPPRTLEAVRPGTRCRSPAVRASWRRWPPPR